MTNGFFNLGFGAGVVLFGATAFAQGGATISNRGAIEVGLRLGIGFPLGNEGKTAADNTNNKLSDDLKAIIPIAVDAGYRINPNVYVGLLFQYGFGIVNAKNNATCNSAGASCSGSDVRLGVDLHFHFAPGQSFDPWLGVGAGYEWLLLSESAGGLNGSGTAAGFELGNIQLGGDIPIAPHFAIGPFVGLSFAQYGNLSVRGAGVSLDMPITSKSFHEWLEFGVRGVYDIGL